MSDVEGYPVQWQPCATVKPAEPPSTVQALPGQPTDDRNISVLVHSVADFHGNGAHCLKVVWRRHWKAWRQNGTSSEQLPSQAVMALKQACAQQ